MKREIVLNLRTRDEHLCREEVNKDTAQMRGTLKEDLLNCDTPDLPWAAEQIAKSYGVYLSFDRAKTGNEKNWMYMIRVAIPGGGPLTKQMWRTLDELSNEFAVTEGGPSLRLTTRQNIQFHWIKKQNLLPLVNRLAASGLTTLNGCGDNTRNVMACPLSSSPEIFGANAWAAKVARYFSLPSDPYIQIFEIDPELVRNDSAEGRFEYGEKLLNRKFKIAFTTVHKDDSTGELHRDNCVEALTNDLALAPIFRENTLAGFQIFLGGGQGERNGKPTMSTLATPFAIVDEQELIVAIDAIVAVHRDWGDRQNRHWARLKYVIKTMGIEWFRRQVEDKLGYSLQDPDTSLDIGARNLHHGWCKMPVPGMWSYGMFIENGRIADGSANGQLKSLVQKLLQHFDIRVTITPNQDLLFNGIRDDHRESFEQCLRSHGYGQRNGMEYSTLRRLSGACVGRDTCRLAYTDSEKFEPYLIDQIEELGWGWLATSIGVTGCERQCFRPATKAIGLVGSGLNLYQLKLLGTEDGRHQGEPLIDDDSSVYLKQIPREKVAIVIDALFRFYANNRTGEEEFGYFNRRVGRPAIIQYLREFAATAPLMQRALPDSSPSMARAEIGC